MGGLTKKKKKKKPKIPDYEALAKQDAAAQRETAEKLTEWNRPTQIDGQGNKLSWSRDDKGNWTQQVELSPEIRQAQQSALSGYTNAMSKLPQEQFKGPESIGRFQSSVEDVKFDPTAGDKLANDMYASVMNRARPEQQRSQDRLDMKLRQQGLQPGTAAYDRAMKNMLTSHGDVATQAGLQSTQAGYQEARERYAQQLQANQQKFGQELSSFSTNLGAQDQDYAQALKTYQTPFDVAGTYANLYGAAPRTEFAGFSGATGYSPADLSGAAQQKYQAQMGNYNASQNRKGNVMSTAGTLGSAYLGSKGMK